MSLQSKYNYYLLLLVLLIGCAKKSPVRDKQAEDSEKIWDLALGQSISASSYLEGFPPESIIDGSGSELCWRIDGLTSEWLELTLDAPGDIERFEMQFGHEYKGDSILVFGRTFDGKYEPLQTFDNTTWLEGNILSYTPDEKWSEIEMVRIEFPNPPAEFCLEKLGLFGRIPGRAPGPYELCRDVPSLIYYNGTIITMDSDGTIAEAVAIKNGKIMAVGSNDEILAMRNVACGTYTRDLQGLFMMPGFNDAHSHWFSWREHECYETGDTIKTYPELNEIMEMISSNDIVQWMD
jgi:hypothetical protein